MIQLDVKEEEFPNRFKGSLDAWTKKLSKVEIVDILDFDVQPPSSKFELKVRFENFGRIETKFITFEDLIEIIGNQRAHEILTEYQIMKS